MQWQVHIDNLNGTFVVIICEDEEQAKGLRDILEKLPIQFIRY